MDQNNILKRIDEIKKEISILPIGTIGTKKINGKNYYYHRYSLEGRRKEEYLDFNEVEQLRIKIEKRKTLETELKSLLHSINKSNNIKEENKLINHNFKTHVRIGEYLYKWASIALGYLKRECYNSLSDYVFSDKQDKVFILYGLRRTGKTTLIRQVILNMTKEQLSKAAFIQVTSKDDLSTINSDLKYLESLGFKYIFIDEITLMKDFIEGASLFSDIYVCSGMKIILSGTDSLGFIFTKYNQLYDRTIMVHTTFIPYREFENVLGIQGIDEYISYGGTMSMGGIHYNEKSLFSSSSSTDEYIDTAIAQNIQHSLEFYQDGGHFRKLIDLYSNNELTSAINRVVNDMNHHFTKQVLTKNFESSVLSLSKKNLLKDKMNPLDINEFIDKDFILKSIKKMLDILEIDEQKVEVDNTYAVEIKEYLLLLDMISEIDLFSFPNITQKEKKTVISQPGLQYAQTQALINSLILDRKFEELSISERAYILSRIMDTIKGRMMEDIVLLETKLSNPKKQVFQLQFAVGEFDMVIQDPIKQTCEIYEIKHSKETTDEQYHYLINEEMCNMTEHYFGTITKRSVIYRGNTKTINEINYINVEEYLNNINK